MGPTRSGERGGACREADWYSVVALAPRGLCSDVRVRATAPQRRRERGREAGLGGARGQCHLQHPSLLLQVLAQARTSFQEPRRAWCTLPYISPSCSRRHARRPEECHHGCEIALPISSASWLVRSACTRRYTPWNSVNWCGW